MVDYERKDVMFSKFLRLNLRDYPPRFQDDEIEIQGDELLANSVFPYCELLQGYKNDIQRQCHWFVSQVHAH